MKRCSKCRTYKPLSEFGKSNKEKSGLRCQCKECDKLQMRAHRAKLKQFNQNTIMENLEMTAQVELITPEVAINYLKFNTCNRPPNQKHIDFLAKEIENGNWKVNGEAITFEGNAMVNGQHRLLAVIKCGIPIRSLVVKGCEIGSFTTYDSGRNRTNAEVFALLDIPNYSGVSSIVRRFLANKVTFNIIRNTGGGFALSGKTKLSKQDMIDEHNSSPELYQQAFSIAASCYSKLKIMARSDIGGMVMLLIKDKKHPQDMVESFFRMLFFSEHVSNSTINLLRDKLIQDKCNNVKLQPSYKSAIFIKTWNAYILGKELKVLSWSEAKEGKIAIL